MAKTSDYTMENLTKLFNEHPNTKFKIVFPENITLTTEDLVTLMENYPNQKYVVTKEQYKKLEEYYKSRNMQDKLEKMLKKNNDTKKPVNVPPSKPLEDFSKKVEYTKESLQKQTDDYIKDLNTKVNYLIENNQLDLEFNDLSTPFDPYHPVKDNIKKEEQPVFKKTPKKEIDNPLTRFKEEQKAKSTQKFNQELLRKLQNESITSSVKPNAKVPNNRSSKVVSSNKLISSIITYGAIAGLTTALTLSTIYYNSSEYKDKVIRNAPNATYNSETFLPNSPNMVSEPNRHWHNYLTLIKETKERFPNPLIGFYYIYYNLDEYCKNTPSCMNELLENFNYIYQTNYQDLEDFYNKNGFQDLKDWQEYVTDSLKEGLGRI